MFIFLKINFIDFFPFQLLLYFYSFFFFTENPKQTNKKLSAVFPFLFFWILYAIKTNGH